MASRMHPPCRSLLFSEHALGIGAWDVRGDPRGRIGRVADELQGVPMLDSLSIVVEPVDIDTGDAGVRRVVSKKIQEVHMRKDVVADSHDPVDYHARPLMRPSELSEILAQGTDPSAMRGLCWM